MKRILFLLAVIIQCLSATAQVTNYSVTATVGTDITLSAPPPRDTERKTLHNVYWSVTSGSSCVTILNATSNPATVRIIGSGTAIVKCEVNYYDPIYWQMDHPIYGTDVRQYGFYTITCQKDPTPTPTPDPDPDPDPDPYPEEDTYGQGKTAEGHLMWFCFTTIYNEKVAEVAVPPFISSSSACIDKSVTGTVTIPSVAHNLPVRRIAGGAFYMVSGLTKVIIPNSVKYVAENAIIQCSSLESVTCENPEPPTGGADHICSNDFNVTLYVPSSSVSKYKNARGWKNFKEIKEIGGQSDVEPIPLQKLTLSASPSGGQVSKGTTVFLTAKANGSTVTGCDIYYTLDGTYVTKSDYKYSSSGISINKDCTLRAVAYKDGYEASDELRTTYSVPTTTKLTLSASPSGGQVSKGTTVFLTAKANGSTVTGCDIYYTLDGTYVTKSDYKYSSSGISINKDCTLRAVAYKDGYEASDELRTTYTIASVQDIEINATNFPDDKFRSWLLAQSYGKDGVLTESEIKNVTSINVSSKSIKSLKGIEYFTALTRLDCYKNQLTALDVSKNTALTMLNCYYNQLTALDVSKNTALEWLECYKNQLTALDVSKNTALEWLECYNNQLTALDVSKNTALKYLRCGGNQLTALDVSKNTALEELSCYNNQLTALDVSKNTALRSLYCHANQLTALDVSKNTNLTKLECYNNQLTALDVSKNTALGLLYSFNNQLTTLDVSKNTALKYLRCYSNQLTALDVSKNTALTELECYDNQLTALDVSKNTALEWLFCGGNQLTALDVSKNTALEWLECYSNQLTALDLSKNTNLTRLYCYNNQLTALDVSKNTALAWLECYNNQLTALDVSKKTALEYLDCSSNQLTALDVSNNTALENLYCSSNQLTALDVSNNTALESLWCYNNSIKGTDMDAIIGSLPQGWGYFVVIDISENATEGNVCTKAQVDAAKAKGWRVLALVGDKDVEYEGSDAEYPVVMISTSKSGYSTFYSSESAYTLPDGLSAQVVTNTVNNKLIYKTIADGSVSGAVPKSTAVMLVSSNKQGGTFTLKPSETTTSYNGTNLLHGSDDATTTTGNGYHYKLSYGQSRSNLNNVFGWYWGNTDGAPFYIEGHKAWLVLPTSATRAGGFSVDGDVLAVGELTTEEAEDGCVFDLQGRRLKSPTQKGVYVKNGRKIVYK